MPFAANIFALMALGTMAGAQSPGAKPATPDAVKKSAQPPLATPPFAPMAVTYVYTATPQSGSPARLGTVPVGVEWVCDKAGCKTIAAWPQPLVENCAALAREIGPLASYGRSEAMLSPTQLDKCNQGIAGAKMIADASKASSTASTPQKTETADPKTQETDGTEPPNTKETEVAVSKAEPEPSTQTTTTETSTETPIPENQANTAAPMDPAGTMAETASANEVVPGPTDDGAPTVTADSGPASQSPSTEGAAPPSGGEAGVEPAAEQSLPTTETALTTPPPVETTASAPSNGVEILVSQLAITGGAQNSSGPRSAMVAITAGELSIVGGAQGAAPQRFEPLRINVPELSIIGRQGE